MPDIDGKLYAATQGIDEARHLEVFRRYVKRLDRVSPIDPALQAVIRDPRSLGSQMGVFSDLGIDPEAARKEIDMQTARRRPDRDHHRKWTRATSQ